MLTTILTVMLWVVVGLVAIILLALCTPVRVSGDVSGLNVNETTEVNIEETKLQFRAVWLLGLVTVTGVKAGGISPGMKLRLAGIPIRLSRTSRERKPEAGDEGKRKGKERASQHRRAKAKRRPRISLRDVKGLLPEVRWIIAKLWRAPRLEARGEMVYGFEDPATTGLCEALRAILPLPRQLKLTPDFTEERLEGWAQVRVTVYPIRVGVVMIRAVFRRGVRRIWWPHVKGRFSRAH